MIYSFNNCQIDPYNFSIQKNGESIAVEPRVFDLIIFLIENRSHVVSREKLFEKVWKGRHVLDATLSNHIKSARNILDDNGQLQKVIKTVHGRGYQFIAPIEEANKEKNFSTFINNRKVQLLAFMFIITLSGLLYFFSIKNNTQPSIQKIAVLPFINISTDTKEDYFGYALTNQIIGDLVYIKQISVRPSASIKKYSSHQDDANRIGEKLGVNYVLSGNYQHTDNKLTLDIELIQVDNNRLVWKKQLKEITYDKVFGIQDRVVRSIVEGIKVELSESEIKHINYDISNNPLAYEYYLRSVAYPYTTDGNKLAIRMLQKSIQLDNKYALSFVQLGDRVHRYEQYGLIKEQQLATPESYYLKALELNPKQLGALGHLAMLYTETNRIDQAIDLTNQMLAINPTNAKTHFTKGYIFRYAGLVDQAIQEMEKAVQLDPLNPKFRSLIGTYSGNQQYHKALKMVDLYKQSPFTLGWKGLMQRRLGRNDLALIYFNQIIELQTGGLWANVATIFKSYILNDKDTGLKSVAKLINPAETDGETLYYASSYYGMFGDKTNCIQTLAKAINAGYFNYPFMESNSYFDSVRNEPEFIGLLNLAKTKHLNFKEMYGH